MTGATSTYAYDNAGALTGIGYGTGAATRTFTYDTLRRLTGDTVTAPGGATTSSATYGYDLDDRLTGRTTVTGGTTVAETFGYDRADRLISRSDGSTTTAYTWDAANNLLNDGAVVNARNQLLSRAGTTYTHTHTPRGTLASRATAGVTVAQAFNAFDELVTDGATAYTYDGFNCLIGAGARSLTYLGTSDTVTGDGTFSYTATPDGTPLGVRTDPHTDLVGTFNPTTGTVPVPAATTPSARSSRPPGSSPASATSTSGPTPPVATSTWAPAGTSRPPAPSPAATPTPSTHATPTTPTATPTQPPTP
jgi:large repetitive protein